MSNDLVIYEPYFNKWCLFRDSPVQVTGCALCWESPGDIGLLRGFFFSQSLRRRYVMLSWYDIYRGRVWLVLQSEIKAHFSVKPVQESVFWAFLDLVPHDQTPRDRKWHMWRWVSSILIYGNICWFWAFRWLEPTVLPVYLPQLSWSTRGAGLVMRVSRYSPRIWLDGCVFHLRN